MATSAHGSLRSTLSQIFSILRLNRKDISAIYIFAILSGLVQLTLPIGVQTIINFVQAGTISTSIVLLIFFVVFGTFMSGLLQVRQMQLIEKIQQKIFVRYSFEFADRIPKLNIQKLDNYYLPELVNRFFDTMTLQKGIAKLLLDLPTATIQILFGLILLSLYHPVFIAFGIVLAITLVFILRSTATRGFDSSIRASNYKYKVAAWFEEMARSLKTFKYAKNTTLHLRQNDKLTTEYINARTELFGVLQTQYWSLIAFKVAITAAMLIVGVILLVGSEPQLNIGQFVAAEIVILTVIASVEKFIVNLDKVYDVLTATQKLDYVTEAETEKNGTIVLQDNTKPISVKFDHVTFGYQANQQVLKQLNLTVNAGEKVAIMGLSGSGRSSLLRLLTGAYLEFEGKIFIADVPIHNYQLASLRNATGILLNQQDIFNGSLLNNITMGCTSTQLSDVTELARTLGFDDYLAHAPNGFETILDPTGARMSKNDKQRILLLRALVGKHSLLLLEEPIKDLQPDEQQRVTNFLLQKTESTVIVTTDNAEFAKQFNKVVILKDGAVVGAGHWNEVSWLFNK
ncbi:MAG TPA: ABC transporter [Chitinophagaceae bacterium]|nr:ABC transporter [Chitinophagaceae bacterium]